MIPKPSYAYMPLSPCRHTSAARHHRCALLSLFLITCPMLVSAMNPQDQMDFADGLYARRLYEMAIREYLVLSREVPDFTQMDTVLFRVGESYRRLGKPGPAERFYQRLVSEHPQSKLRFRGQLRRAELYIVREKYREAVPLFNALLDDDPTEEVAASSLYYLGYAFKQLERSEEAKVSFREVIEKHKTSPFVSFACLELAELYQDDPEAKDKRVALYQQAADEPASPRVGAEALFQLAEAAYRGKRYTNSVQVYRVLMETYPDDPRAKEAKLQAAWSYYYADQCREGQAFIVTGLDGAGPKEKGEWLYLKANCDRRAGKADEALKTYEALLKTYRETALGTAAAYEKSLILFQRDAFRDVITELSALDLSGGIEEDVYWLLAKSYDELGRYVAATNFYTRVAQAFQESDKAPQALFRVAGLLQERLNFKAAAETFLRVAEGYAADPLAPRALFHSAYCLTRLNRYEEAIGRWDLLLEKYPVHELAEESWYQKGLSEIQIEDLNAAAQTLLRFAQNYPESKYKPEAHYWLGVLSDEKGNVAEAERHFRMATNAVHTSWIHKARYRLAGTLQKQERWKEAAVLLQGLLDTSGSEVMPPALLEWLARYRLKGQEYSQAVQAATNLLRTARQPVWQQIGASLLGSGLAKQNRMEEAAAMFKLALAQEAETREGAEAALQLGDIRLAQQKTEEARTCFEQAAERAGDDRFIDIRAKSYHGLGKTALQKNDCEEAARYFMSVAILFDDPELTPESLYRAAECFGLLDRKSDQRRALKELLERYPEHTCAKDVNVKKETLKDSEP